MHLREEAASSEEWKQRIWAVVLNVFLFEPMETCLMRRKVHNKTSVISQREGTDCIGSWKSKEEFLSPMTIDIF